MKWKGGLRFTQRFSESEPAALSHASTVSPRLSLRDSCLGPLPSRSGPYRCPQVGNTSAEFRRRQNNGQPSPESANDEHTPLAR